MSMSRIRWTAVFFAASIAWPTTAAAERTMKWCGTWLAHYVDAGLGEVVLDDPDPQHVPARFARAIVTSGDDDHYVWNGRLDRFGCTPDLPVDSETLYKLWQATYISTDDDRVTVIEPEGHDWGEVYTFLISYFRTAALPADGVFTHTFHPSWHTPQSNIAPVAALVIESHERLSYPAETRTLVRTDRAACDITAYLGRDEVCVRSDYGGEDHTAWKYVIAHELGHRVAGALDGPVHVTYNHFPAPDACTCRHVRDIEAAGLGQHCLQSREYIGAAEAEGWAHAFAAAVFNVRTTAGCWFNYYKTVRAPSGVLTEPPYRVQCDRHVRWMETTCDPGDDDLGIEWDWLTFYWRLYAADDPRLRFSFGELGEIWADTPTSLLWRSATIVGQAWDDLLTTVDERYGAGSDRAEFFRDTGVAAGIDHYLVE